MQLNFVYTTNTSNEVDNLLQDLLILSKDEISEKYNCDIEDVDDFIKDVKEDLEVIIEKEEEKNVMGVDDRQQPYANPLLYI